MGRRVWVCLRLLSLQCGEVRFELVVGIVLFFDLVVYAGDFLQRSQH